MIQVFCLISCQATALWTVFCNTLVSYLLEFIELTCLLKIYDSGQERDFRFEVTPLTQNLQLTLFWKLGQQDVSEAMERWLL